MEKVKSGSRLSTMALSSNKLCKKVAMLTVDDYDIGPVFNLLFVDVRPKTFIYFRKTSTFDPTVELVNFVPPTYVQVSKQGSVPMHGSDKTDCFNHYFSRFNQDMRPVLRRARISVVTTSTDN
jgi:hypothetical protein